MRNDGWRPNLNAAPHTLVFRHGDEEIAIDAVAEPGGWRLRIGDREYRAAATSEVAGRLGVTLDGERRSATVLEHAGAFAVFAGGDGWRFEIVDPLAAPADADTSAGRLSAPMPGRVVQLLVAPGDAVRRGQPLIVVEAMKMEHTVAAPRDGIVAAVRCAVGELVDEGAELIALAEPAA
jgi:3-methylcrotonyl-CoA carboxylase alpha subunit